MKKSLAIILTLVLAFTMLASGCSTQEATSKPSASSPAQSSSPQNGEDVIKIGWFGPLTGSNATQGISQQNAIALYVKELNEKGGLLGKKIEVFYYDDASNTEEAVKIATRLIEVDKVDLVAGSLISNCMLATGKMFNDAKIPTFGTGLSPTWMSKGWEYLFRTSLNTQLSITTLPKLMTEEFGYKSVAVFEGQDDYGVSAGQSLRDAATKAGMTVTTTENYVAGDTDFSGQIAKIMNSKPDCVFLGVLSGDVGNIVKQFRQYGYDGILFYSENVQQDIIKVAGEAADRIVFAYPYVLYDSPEEATDEYMKEFLTKYYAEYGEMPGGDCGYRGWDTMAVIDKAANIAGTVSGEKFREAVLSISDMKSLGGKFDFTKTKNGECLFEFNTYVIVDGKNVLLKDWFESDDYKNWKASH